MRVPEQLSEGGHALVLNGAGLRTKFVVKVYVAALYASARSQDAAALINSNEPRRGGCNSCAMSTARAWTRRCRTDCGTIPTSRSWPRCRRMPTACRR
ncbi:chalcone isomerase family protein [Achromobacter insuavis]